MKMKYLPTRIKPREKALNNGIDSLDDVELLAIILRTGTKKDSVISLANRIISEIGCLSNLSKVSLNQLTLIDGIGEIKALELLAIAQLSKRINKVAINKFIYANNPLILYNLYQKQFEFVQQEHFVIVSLNAKNAIINERTIFVGTLSQSLVHPREVFKQVIINSASSFICLHNHPSGDPQPSQNDIDVTMMLKEIGDLLAIPLLDHIIIGKASYFSFKENEYF
ncbi:DNA repair protein RadC [Erysipelotrichaceae bacterium OttesenSCG-928-M19]|nr:DNA repair protein RadC [Erysipelotrichaceae bacterium OttesenSCG-928-M19]